MDNTCKRLKKLRLDAGLTLEEVGNKIGVGKSTVRKWEVGMIENMRKDKIKALADIYGVSPAYIMGYDVPETETSAVSTLVSALDTNDSDLFELISIYSKMDSETRKMLVALAKKLI